MCLTSWANHEPDSRLSHRQTRGQRNPYSGRKPAIVGGTHPSVVFAVSVVFNSSGFCNSPKASEASKKTLNSPLFYSSVELRLRCALVGAVAELSRCSF
jgi:hypothetical protein